MKKTLKRRWKKTLELRGKTSTVIDTASLQGRKTALGKPPR